MTTPASGAISMASVNTEVAAAAGTLRDMAWIKANTKVAATSLNAIRNMAWFQWKGNAVAITPNCLSQSNCVSTLNCNCANCVCSGGDTRAWLQTNCNCNCSGNCQCNCNCNCNCRC